MEIIIQLIVTIIGVALGFLLAVAWDRRKIRNDYVAKIKSTLSSIIEEIKRTQLVLQDIEFVKLNRDENSGSVSVEINFYTGMLDSAFKASIHSGNLSLLPSDVQVELSNYYSGLNIANTMLLELYRIFPTLNTKNITITEDYYRYIKPYCENFLLGLSKDVIMQLDQVLVEKRFHIPLTK